MANVYYQSHQKLPFVKEIGQQKISAAKVLVIGAGGVGCPCLQALAGAGVGNLAIADFDTISLSNLHRQALYTVKDVGKLKSKIAVKHLRKLNPFIKIKPYAILVDEHNILSLLKSYQIIIDATDNFETRYLINDACVILNKPLVYGAIHQAEGHFTVFNYKGSGTLRCLFPLSDTQNAIQSCADLGAYNIITSLIGNYMASEVIKIILENSSIACNKLVCIDALSATAISFLYSLNKNSLLIDAHKFTFKFASNLLTPLQIIEKAKNQKVVFIDVRSLPEREVFNIGGQHKPLTIFLKTQIFSLSNLVFYVFYCQKGLRSKKAVSFCIENGFHNCFSLENGLSWDKNLLNELKNLQ